MNTTIENFDGSILQSTGLTNEKFSDEEHFNRLLSNPYSREAELFFANQTQITDIVAFRRTILLQDSKREIDGVMPSLEELSADLDIIANLTSKIIEYANSHEMEITTMTPQELYDIYSTIAFGSTDVSAVRTGFAGSVRGEVRVGIMHLVDTTQNIRHDEQTLDTSREKHSQSNLLVYSLKDFLRKNYGALTQMDFQEIFEFIENKFHDKINRLPEDVASQIRLEISTFSANVYFASMDERAIDIFGPAVYEFSADMNYASHYLGNLKDEPVISFSPFAVEITLSHRDFIKLAAERNVPNEDSYILYVDPSRNIPITVFHTNIPESSELEKIRKETIQASLFEKDKQYYSQNKTPSDEADKIVSLQEAKQRVISIFPQFARGSFINKWDFSDDFLPTNENVAALLAMREALLNSDGIYFEAMGALGDSVIYTAFILGIQDAMRKLGRGNTPLSLSVNYKYYELYKAFGEQFGISIFPEHNDRLTQEMDTRLHPFVFKTGNNGPTHRVEDNENGCVVSTVTNIYLALPSTIKNRYARIVESLLHLPRGFINSEIEPTLALPPNADEIAADLQSKYGLSLNAEGVAILTGGTWLNKRYPLQLWRKTLEYIQNIKPGVEFHVVYDPQEIEREYTRKSLESAFYGLNTKLVKGSLTQMAVLLAQERAIIAHDTGLAHVAGALGRPVVTIYGDPNFPPSVWSSTTRNHIVEAPLSSLATSDRRIAQVQPIEVAGPVIEIIQKQTKI